MARIRNIKPEFFADEKVGALPFGARLLFVGLWTRCDLRGVFEWNAKIITAALFPYDDGVDANQVVEWLQALSDAGMVVSFEASGRRWGTVPRFSDHQAIGKAERDYDAKAKVRYPSPPGHQNGSGADTVTVSETVSETVTETTGRRTKDEGRRTEEAHVSESPPPPRVKKSSARQELAKTLRRLGLQATEDRDGNPGTITEWSDLMQGRGGCRTVEEALEGVAWIVRNAQGATIAYAKHAGNLADAWRARIERERAKDLSRLDAAVEVAP